MRSATVISRMPASFAPRRAPSFLGLAAVACLALAACSPGADYPSLFPAVHDTPPPRADTPLDANQVQQATEDLISARDRLSAEAQGAQGKNSTSSAVKPAAKSSANSAGKPSSESSSKSSGKPATGPAAARKQPSPPANAQQTFGTDAEQTAGAETK